MTYEELLYALIFVIIYGLALAAVASLAWWLARRIAHSKQHPKAERSTALAHSLGHRPLAASPGVGLHCAATQNASRRRGAPHTYRGSGGRLRCSSGRPARDVRTDRGARKPCGLAPITIIASV